MSLSEDFSSAQTRVKQLRRQPSVDELLDLYALYKQSTLADAQGKRPDMLDIRGRAKHDAWAKRKGMTKEAAMQEYVDLVAKLVARYS
jgi:diazepam-binding inhibitor (GABA receptor modulating acyl-CoA-binding protein)